VASSHEEVVLSGKTTATGPIVRKVTLAVAFGLAVMLAAPSTQGASAPEVLRVCADPDNMPFSNEKGDGFENKLAELIAEKLDYTLEYVWFSESSGNVPNVTGEDACDLIMGYLQGTRLIDDTNPYYYTSYVLIYRADDPSLAGINRLSDPRLKNKRIGLVARTPPTSILAMHGLLASAKPFEVSDGDQQSKAAADMIAEIASGKLDAGLLWGPIGGYYAQRSEVPLNVVPLVKERAGPSTIYSITLGLRPNEPQWKHRVNKVLAENQRDINVILRGYGIPLMDPDGEPIELGAAER
jgi:quinoprotein dehydrogenase-associated probable ABC transporter substrate-binding protein